MLNRTAEDQVSAYIKMTGHMEAGLHFRNQRTCHSRPSVRVRLHQRDASQAAWSWARSDPSSQATSAHWVRSVPCGCAVSQCHLTKQFLQRLMRVVYTVQEVHSSHALATYRATLQLAEERHVGREQRRPLLLLAALALRLRLRGGRCCALVQPDSRAFALARVARDPLPRSVRSLRAKNVVIDLDPTSEKQDRRARKLVSKVVRAPYANA